MSGAFLISGRQKNMNEKKSNPEIKKSRYQEIKEGLREPEGAEKGYKNLRPDLYNFSVIDPEKRKEICRKGAAAVNKLHGEKKSARESLEKILTLKIDDSLLNAADVPADLAQKLKRDNPNATIYDLIHIVAVGRAVGGSIPAMQYIRDTHGDKPIDRVQADINNIMTDADRDLLQGIGARLQDAEKLYIVDQAPGDPADSEKEKDRERKNQRKR